MSTSKTSRQRWLAVIRQDESDDTDDIYNDDHLKNDHQVLRETTEVHLFHRGMSCKSKKQKKL
jgi:hypothetical protein